MESRPAPTSARGPLSVLPRRVRIAVEAAWEAVGRVHPSVLFALGVLWDWGTLKIDRLADNLLLSAYLLALIAIFVLELRGEARRWVPRWAAAHPKRLRQAEQFLLGALLSAFWVQVVKALHPGPAAVFATLLIAVAIANETGFGPLRAALARGALVTFCSFQLLSILIPLITKELVPIGIPLMGALTVAATMLVLAQVERSRRTPLNAITDLAAPISAAALCGFALLGAIKLGLVPALPLVLREGEIARSVEWRGDSLQVDRFPSTLAQDLGISRQQIRVGPGQGLSAYTAIYAPSGMELELFHQWEWRDPEVGGWVTSDKIELDVSGGTKRGWRTWSTKQNLREGDWRVRVLTPHGQELGRLVFTIHGA